MSPRHARVVARLHPANPASLALPGTNQGPHKAIRPKSKLAAFLARDYFPTFDHHLQFARTPLGVLLITAALSALCGWLLHPHGFVLCAGILAILLLGVIWPWLSLRGLRGAIRFGQNRCHEGESVPIRVELRNRAAWNGYGLGVELGLPAADAGTAGIARAAAWRTTVADWPMLFRQRGEYPVRDAFITCGFPFGLWQAKRRLAAANRLLVWPRTFPVGALPEFAGERTFDGAIFHNRPGIGGDLLGVRPYRRGDSLRRVHWGQTARHDRLITCEFQAASLPWIQIMLDIDPASHCGQGADSSREWAIRIAASFVEDWIEQGALVELCIGAKRFPAASGRRQRDCLLDALARIRPEQGPPLAQLLLDPVCTGFEGGLQVIVTTDLAIRRYVANKSRDPHVRWVVLRAQAFADADGDEAAATPLSFRPWIEIANARQVPERVRAGVQGGCHA